MQKELVSKYMEIGLTHLRIAVDSLSEKKIKYACFLSALAADMFLNAYLINIGVPPDVQTDILSTYHKCYSRNKTFSDISSHCQFLSGFDPALIKDAKKDVIKSDAVSAINYAKMIKDFVNDRLK